jgi:hypothetical protein
MWLSAFGGLGTSKRRSISTGNACKCSGEDTVVISSRIVKIQGAVRSNERAIETMDALWMQNRQLMSWLKWSKGYAADRCLGSRESFRYGRYSRRTR